MVELYTGIGLSALKDSYKAGVESAKKALSQLGQNKKPNVLIVFGAPRFKQQRLLDGITAVTKKTPMIGGTTAGEISSYGLSVNSVVVMALHSEDIRFFEGMGKGINKSESDAGAELATNILKKAGKNKSSAKSLIFLPDGLAGDGVSIIDGAKKVLGEFFEIVGGALGDEDAFKHTYQYYNGKVYENTVVGLLICGNVVTATGVRSGWESIGSRFKCTSAKGNVVYKFGDNSALEMYEEYLGKERAKKLPAIGLEYPMGLIDEKAKIEGYDYFQIRCPVGINKKKGSVTFAAAIPEGKEVTLTYSSRNSIIKGSKLSALQSKKTLGKARPLLVMMFSCVARKMVLGRRTNEEIDEIKNVFGNTPIIGFYTYGEIGPIDKRVDSLRSSRWHNETVVVWVLGAKN